VKGSKSGLFLNRESVHVNTLLIVEGPTDTAAAIDIGFPVIGHPACLGCEDMIVELVREHGAGTTLIIADANEPGQRGAFDKYGAIARSVLAGILARLWGTGCAEALGDLIQLSVKGTHLRSFLRCWHHNRDLHRRQLSSQRKHLVHRDTGSDRCIAQLGLPDRFLHAFSHISQQRNKGLFSFGYILSFTMSDGGYGVRGYAVKLGDLIHAGVRIGQ